MSDNTFVLPADVELTIQGETLHLRYDGNVVLEQDLGTSRLAVEAGGDLEIDLPTVEGTLRAGGVLRIPTPIRGGTLHAREVFLGEGPINCDAISATERIVIGPAKLQVDVIIAPEIQIDASATGRVTVIESMNERGPTKIKGGFSVDEYDELIGNADAFLEERGVAPLGEAPAEPAPSLADVVTRPAPDDDDMDDPLSLSSDDLTPLDLDDDIEEDELYQALSDAVERITTCYEDSEVPPPVDQLRDLVEQRDYDELRDEITEVWNGLLGYHQQRGIRPHHQVTHAFNVIHGLLQPA